VKVAVCVSFFLACLAPSAHAADLRRLFHTPAERKALDAARANPSQPQKPARENAIRSPEPPRLHGYVVRSDGLSTVWIDGRAVRVAAKER